MQRCHVISGEDVFSGRTKTATLYQSDCRELLRSLADNSIDSVVTDPPYALVSIAKRFGKEGSAPAKGNDAYERASAGFMGKSWDTGEVAFSEEFWAEVLRVLKPGGHVVSFSGTRTYHRMAVAIEDAGFEIRDQLAWMYGSGFPKSHDVSKAIDKHLGAVRETVRIPAEAVRNQKTVGGGRDGADGATRPYIEAAIEAGFHELPGEAPATPEAAEWSGWGTALKPAWEPICLARKPLSEKSVAANALRWGVGALNIDGCRVGDDLMARTTGNGILVSKNGSVTGGNYGRIAAGEIEGRWPANIAHDESGEVLGCFPDPATARFFYSAKASRDDRDEGLEELDLMAAGALSGRHDGSLGSITMRANTHPTVKPTDLMQWLCRMVTPKGGIVLDPFMGSGSTGKAALREDMDFIGCEREDEYMPIAAARVATGLNPARPKPKSVPANDNGMECMFGEASSPARGN